MLTIRTDLAQEAHSLWRESAGETTRLAGVKARDSQVEGFPLHRVEILDEAGERALGKPRGVYLTLDMTAFWRREPEQFSRLTAALAQVLSPLLPEEGPVLVVALAARGLSRLCSTIQVSDTGLIPGSGVGNHRMALNRETLGVPVVSLGVPTVVDAATVARDILAEQGREEAEPAALQGRGASLFVTPDSIDAKVRDLAKVVGYGINLALQPGLEPEDLTALLE